MNAINHTVAAMASSQFDLTPLQMGMVYESVLVGRPWVNLEQVVVHFDSEKIDPAALRQAWLETTARHDALRLSILWRKRAVPVQVVHAQATSNLTVEDWSEDSPQAQAKRLERYLELDREHGTDLEAAPSWRVALMKLGARRAVMVWTIHHALIDGRSMVLVLDEVFARLRGDQVTPLPETDFRGYCQGLAGRDTDAARAHFRSLLEGYDPPEPATPGQNARTARKLLLHRRLDEGLGKALRARADAAGASLANLIQVAWGLVMARWHGEAEAVIGVTRAGRHTVEGCARTVGCLINTLPQRIIAQDEAGGVDALLQEARRQMLALRPHDHAPLASIRNWCLLTGDTPLFDSLVMFERASLDGIMRNRHPDWAKRRVELHEEGASPLTLAVYAEPEILLVVEHDPAGVPAARAQAILDHLTGVLSALAQSGPETLPGALDMLTAEETTILRALGQPSRALAPAVPCIVTRLAQTTATHAARPALSMVGSDAQIDHATLMARADGLAARLLAAGAVPGAVVAICLERSPEFIISIIAVLKTGAGFLPVDPSYPEAVRTHMLSDSRARLIIAEEGTEVPGDLTRLSPDQGEAPPVAPLAPDPDRLAYVIYTSGSTGKPKGVRVPQRAISAHASAIIAAFDLRAEDRVLQFASLSFDVSIEETLPTLIAGAELVLRDEAMAGSIAMFLEAVEDCAITVLNLPTAFWHVLVDDMARNGRTLPESVRLVVVGGEQVNPKALATWQRIAPRPRWLNGYGPTETTITCTLHEPGPQPPGEDIPIGRPTAHARAYVLSADRSLAPRGVTGELWIGGPAVSDGYIGREADTAAAFRPDPFAGTGRMYRTGDRARWREDGTLAFHGRRDRQVKLRGFRIDLRHVEQVLEGDESVGRALAGVVDGNSGAARLVAWVVGAEAGPPPDLMRLQGLCKRQLPSHMRPALVILQEFPRTPGGKIDRAALPAPRATDPSAPHEAPARSDRMTRRMVALMAQTLGLETVDPDDRFHDLGGHSLLAVQLLGRIEAETGQRIGIADLHRNPTPRKLAATLGDLRFGPRYIVPIQPEGRKMPIFGVHVLGRNEEFYRPLAAELGPDQPMMGLTIGPMTEDTPTEVAQIARCYFDDIQRHYPEGPIGLMAVSLGAFTAFELAHQLLKAGRDVRLLTLFDAEGPGGRARLAGAARLKAHLLQAREQGPIYIRHVLGNRIDTLRHRLEKLRVRRASAAGGPPPMTVDGFVAANELAVQAYEARPIAIPLTIFRARDDVFDSPDCLLDGLGWGPVAAAGFKVIDVPGDHLGILRAPNVATLASHLRSMLS